MYDSRNYSTLALMLNETILNIQMQLENENCVVGVYLDLSKAFDKLATTLF